MFHSVWVHLGLFRYGSKLGTKRIELVQLMQKLMPLSHIGIFQNKCTRSTALDPILMFWCVYSVLVHLGMFYYDSKLGAKWAKLVQVMQKFVPRSHIGIFRNERTQSSPLDPKLMFRSVL